MKSEERHELKSNDLQNFVKSAKPFLEKHGNKLIFGAIAVLVVGVISVVAMNKSREAKTAGWAEMAIANSAEDFANIAEDHAGTPVARMAQLNQANLLYDKGVQFMFTDRSAGMADLTKAQELYEGLLNDKATSDQIREHALYGRARCLEATSSDNTQPAIDGYDQLIQEFPDTLYKAKAEQRIKELATAEAKDFYKWFEEQDPKPVDRTAPRDLPLQGTGTVEEKTEPAKTEPEKTEPVKTEEQPAEKEAEKPEDKKTDESASKEPEKKPEAETKPADKKESGESSAEEKKESADKK